ncbi:hypothetical protein DOTSEDRAFT_32642 [Dothistroma septosporum NZE10]|uniref:SnoaL-like domain-containing protein n=1 Tax=Dothistroma septosporum (strain NZE10 / CBS 128990) TaxID=675120 RepID=N1PR64_DOTSN|nr:hypothetical protein DOTSEDRAFT_32642 [Dothistroma septosporum NZE10]
MAEQAFLTGLTPREAVADALHRCILGLDSNNHSLFESACVKDSSMTIIAGPLKLEGWNAIDDYFQRVFAVVTTHTISNVRVELKDGADTANMTAHAVSYHIRPDDALKPEDTSYTASCLYEIDLVRDAGDGLWKIQTWDLKILWTTRDIKVLHGLFRDRDYAAGCEA